MKRAAQSVVFFGYYLLGLSMVLIFAPNTLLSLFQMEPTSEVWIRVVGVVVLALGIYYVRVGPTENKVFLQTTIWVRSMVLVWFVVFVLAGWVSAPIILFGLVDVAGAAWTWWALKKA